MPCGLIIAGGAPTSLFGLHAEDIHGDDEASNCDLDLPQSFQPHKSLPYGVPKGESALAPKNDQDRPKQSVEG